jgi:hypothetical protein
MLYEKRLPLLDPVNWDDKNDAYFMELYKKKKKLKTLLALCFAKSEESYHHWKIYAGDTSGVCIQFKHHDLLNRLMADTRFRLGPVEYMEISHLERNPPTIDNLPFIKRLPFQDECEYRIIYENRRQEEKLQYIQITAEDIDHITINPWLHESVFESIKSVIRGIGGCERIGVFQTTVVGNEKWKRIGSQAVASDPRS